MIVQTAEGWWLRLVWEGKSLVYGPYPAWADAFAARRRIDRQQLQLGDPQLVRERPTQGELFPESA